MRFCHEQKEEEEEEGLLVVIDWTENGSWANFASTFLHHH